MSESSNIKHYRVPGPLVRQAKLIQTEGVTKSRNLGLEALRQEIYDFMNIYIYIYMFFQWSTA